MGAVTRMITGKPSSGERPNKENYGNPYIDELMPRLLASIDQYKDTHSAGWRNQVPTEMRPYEWRSDAERAGIRERETQRADDENRPARRFGVNEPDAPKEDDSPEAREDGSKRMLMERATLQNQQSEEEGSAPDREDMLKQAVSAVRLGKPVRQAARQMTPSASRGPYAEQAEQLRKFIYGG